MMSKKVREWIVSKPRLRKFLGVLWPSLKEEYDHLFLYHNTSSQPLYQIRADTKLDSLVFTGNSGEDIFRIDPDGNAYWLKEDSYDEAAEMLLIAANWHLENATGIQQSRMEWEKNITEALVRAAEERGGTLTAEELTDVVRKCIMYDKLKGKYGEN
jgi:hypothetical protein